MLLNPGLKKYVLFPMPMFKVFQIILKIMFKTAFKCIFNESMESIWSYSMYYLLLVNV